MDNHSEPITVHRPLGGKKARFILLAAKHRMAILIISTIAVAIGFSAVGLALYHVSGTAQLDLSRPGFEGVSEIVDQNAGTYVEYPASGAINQQTLDEFDKLYGAQLDNITAPDAFGGDPLDPASLRISNPNGQE